MLNQSINRSLRTSRCVKLNAFIRDVKVSKAILVSRCLFDGLGLEGSDLGLKKR